VTLWAEDTRTRTDGPRDQYIEYGIQRTPVSGDQPTLTGRPRTLTVLLCVLAALGAGTTVAVADRMAGGDITEQQTAFGLAAAATLTALLVCAHLAGEFRHRERGR
jgi:hypothetical protein